MKMPYIKGEDFMDYLVNQKNSIQLISNIILSYNHLLKSITMLISKDIIHYDIKGSNIIFNENKEIPVLIDFGLSIQKNTINKDNLNYMFYVYAPEYYIWSLEVHYMCYLVNKNKEPNNDELEEICKKYVDGNKALQRNFSPKFIN